MIKLKTLITESTAEKNATSWLDPHGKFHPINYSHGSTARDLVGNVNDPMMVLFKKGWQRVTYYSYGTLHINNPVIPPNDRQKRLVIDLTKELGFKELKYDNDEGFKTIWSDSDTLQEIRLTS